MDLSSQQLEALLNFKAISDISDDNLALHYLRQSQWDVTRAVNDYWSESSVPRYPSAPRPAARSSSTWLGSRIKSLLSDLWNNVVPQQMKADTSSSAESLIKKLSVLSETPPVFSGKYLQDILVEAKNRQRMVFLLLDAGQGFAELLCNEAIVAVLNENFIAWGVDAQSFEGKQARALIKPDEVPCVVVLRVSDVRAPTIQDTLVGLPSFDQLLEFLGRNIQKTIDHMAANDPFFQERQIRAQQEKELIEAEQIVRMRQREQEEKERQLKEQMELEEKKKEERREIALEKLRRIGEEPDESGQTASLSFRIFDGRKVDRRFVKTKMVEELYDFVESLVDVEFEIVSGFPHAVLDKGVTIEDAGLCPKAVVHVRECLDSLIDL